MTAILVLFLVLGAAFFVMHRIEKRYDQDVQDGEKQKQRHSPRPAPEAVQAQTSPPSSRPAAVQAKDAHIKIGSRHEADVQTAFSGQTVPFTQDSFSTMHSPLDRPSPAAQTAPKAIGAERLAVMERAVEHMEGALLELKAELQAFRESAASSESAAARSAEHAGEAFAAASAGKAAFAEGQPGMAGTFSTPDSGALSPSETGGQADARDAAATHDMRKPGDELVSPGLPVPGAPRLAAKSAATPSAHVKEDGQGMEEWPGREAEAMAVMANDAALPGAASAEADILSGETAVSGSAARNGWAGELPPGGGVRRSGQFGFQAAHEGQAGAQERPREESVRRPAAPLEPGFMERAWQSLGELGIAKFLGASNIWVLAGIGLLLVGLVFLVRFAIEFGILGPEARLGVAALVGLALLATGWRHRETRRELGLILQGGGVGALYLTVVAAVKLYALLPQPLALALLVGIVAFSTAIAVIQNAKIMAHIANGAGFLAPVLVSSDSGNYVALFSFYILLNLGIMGISRFRQWRSLHLTAFVFTAGIGGLWGMSRYEPSLFLSVEPFLLAFFVIFTYLAIAGSRPSSFSLHRKADVFIDAPLTLATPLVFILYQAVISEGRDFVLAFTSLALGLLYLSIARFMWNSRNNTASEASWMERTIGQGGGPGNKAASGSVEEDGQGDASGMARADEGEQRSVPDAALAALIKKGRTLQAEIYLAFGIVFTNLALPLALYDLGLYNWAERLLSLIWALEGASLVWLGRRNAMRLFRVFGMFSLILGFIYVLRYVSHGAPLYLADPAEAALSGGGNYLDLGISLLLHLFGAAAFTMAALAVHRYRLADEAPDAQQVLRRILLGGAAVWLYGAFLFEFISLDHYWELVLLACAITAPLGNYLARRFDWRELTATSLACYVPYLILFLPQVLVCQISYTLGVFFSSTGQLWTFGALLLFTLYDLFLLYRTDKERPPLFGCLRLVGMLNALPVILAVCTVSAAVFLQERMLAGSSPALSDTWMLALCVIWPCLFLGLGAGREKLLFLTATARRSMAACAMPAAFLVFWFVWNIFELGNPAPLPYVPVLNPLEAALLASAFVLYIWVAKVHAALPGNPVIAVAGRQAFWVAVLFLLANVTVARACTFWLDMPFTLHGVMRNGSCQGVMAVLWALTGFAAMLYGHKTLQRSLWLSGVVLMAADVAKLFFIDLTRVETLWRIVAFMAVGLLLIVIGYKVPLPPARRTEEVEKGDTVDEGSDA